jgi:hypothetical protein
MAEPTGNKAGRSSTGSFDFDILKQLMSIQSGIKTLVKMTAAQQEKPYQEAIDSLQKAVPKEKEKKGPIVFKLPKLPAGKSILDGLFNLGKIALAGAFLAGLLKDKIVEIFNAWDPATLLGGALKDLFTSQEGEPSWKERIKEALESMAFWGLIGGATGFVIGGPVGMLAGAMIGAGLSGFISLLSTDSGVKAQLLADKLKRYFKTAGTFAGIGGIVGSAFGMTIPGVVAGAILGFALQGVYEAIATDRAATKLRNPETESIGAAIGIIVQRLADFIKDRTLEFANFVIRNLNKILPKRFEIKEFKVDTAEMDEAEDRIRVAKMKELELRVERDEEIGGEGRLLRASDAEIAYVKSKTGFDLNAEATHPDSIYEHTKVPEGWVTKSMKLAALWENAKRRAKAQADLEEATRLRDQGKGTPVVTSNTDKEIVTTGYQGREITISPINKEIIISPINKNSALVETVSEGDSAFQKMLDAIIASGAGTNQTVVGMNQSTAGDNGSGSLTTTGIATESQHKLTNRILQHFNLFGNYR